ncbi:hypothetical protein [Microbispora hainanensis]|uniref:hypothetical protein n=1 Tax=Microbispora hainanensis TaxID=568844 RepID=UPI001ABF6389|nr:hypothetical protein [Microbispora hainanensis]
MFGLVEQQHGEAFHGDPGGAGPVDKQPVGAPRDTCQWVHTGRPRPTRQRLRDCHRTPAQAIDAEAAGDGWYALLTNLGPDQADAEQILRLYKGQEAVERRYWRSKARWP